MADYPYQNPGVASGITYTQPGTYPNQNPGISSGITYAAPSRGIDYSQPTSRTFGNTTPSVSPSQDSGSINVTTGSTGGPGFGRTPDLSYADAGTLNRLNIGDLIWSPTAGGYLTSNEANNANSYYNKFGAGQGGDPTANRRASAYYNYIGSLPTTAIGTPALNQLYAQTGQRPSAGPSFNSMLSGIFSNASPYMQNQFRDAGFGPTYTGPYGFGQRNPDYSIWGQYKPGVGGGPMTGTAW